MGPVALVFSLALAAYSRMPDWTQLNDPTTSTWATDAVQVGAPRDVLTEEKHDASWSVTYSLTRFDDGGLTGLRLVLKIRNLSSSPADAVPLVKLLNADGVLLPPADRQQILELGEEMAGTQIPELRLDRSPPSGGFAGGFSQGFDNGRARGEHARAMIRADDGQQLIALASTSGLQTSAALDPQEATVGALLYLAPAKEPLPMRIRVRLGDTTFEFTTRATVPDRGLQLHFQFRG